MKKSNKFVPDVDLIFIMTRDEYINIVKNDKADKSRIKVDFKEISELISSIYIILAKDEVNLIDSLCSKLSQSKNYFYQVVRHFEKRNKTMNASFYQKLLTDFNLNPVMIIEKTIVTPPIYIKQKNIKNKTISGRIESTKITYEVDKLSYTVLVETLENKTEKGNLTEFDKGVALFSLIITMFTLMGELPRFEFKQEDYVEETDEHLEDGHDNLGNGDPEDINIDAN